MQPGLTIPTALLRDTAGAEVPLPREGLLLLLAGAFRPEAAPACAQLPRDAVVIVPDAPPVARAWAEREGVRQDVLCDHRPRGAVQRSLGFDPDRARIGLRLLVRAGVVLAATELLAPSATDTRARAPAPAGGYPDREESP